MDMILAALIVVQTGLWYVERRHWAVERKQLMDRVQSGNLAEYKAFEAPINKPLPKKAPDEDLREI